MRVRSPGSSWQKELREIAVAGKRRVTTPGQRGKKCNHALGTPLSLRDTAALNGKSPNWQVRQGVWYQHDAPRAANTKR